VLSGDLEEVDHVAVLVVEYFDLASRLVE